MGQKENGDGGSGFYPCVLYGLCLCENTMSWLLSVLNRAKVTKLGVDVKLTLTLGSLATI